MRDGGHWSENNITYHIYGILTSEKLFIFKNLSEFIMFELYLFIFDLFYT